MSFRSVIVCLQVKVELIGKKQSFPLLRCLVEVISIPLEVVFSQMKPSLERKPHAYLLKADLHLAVCKQFSVIQLLLLMLKTQKEPVVQSLLCDILLVDTEKSNTE